MKTFQFTLQKLFEYKNSVLKSEKSILADLNNEKNIISEKIGMLEKFRLEKKLELKRLQLEGINLWQLNSSTFLINNAKHQIHDLELEQYEITKKIIEQRQVVIEISKEINGLEKLEEKQKFLYTKETEKINETQIAEYVSSSSVAKEFGT